MAKSTLQIASTASHSGLTRMPSLCALRQQHFILHHILHTTHHSISQMESVLTSPRWHAIQHPILYRRQMHSLNRLGGITFYNKDSSFFHWLKGTPFCIALCTSRTISHCRITSHTTATASHSATRTPSPFTLPQRHAILDYIPTFCIIFHIPLPMDHSTSQTGSLSTLPQWH